MPELWVVEHSAGGQGCVLHDLETSRCSGPLAGAATLGSTGLPSPWKVRCFSDGTVVLSRPVMPAEASELGIARLLARIFQTLIDLRNGRLQQVQICGLG